MKAKKTREQREQRRPQLESPENHTRPTDRVISRVNARGAGLLPLILGSGRAWPAEALSRPAPGEGVNGRPPSLQAGAAEPGPRAVPALGLRPGHVTRRGQWAGGPRRGSYKGACRCPLAPPLG